MKKKSVVFLIVIMMIMLISSSTVYAGSINGAEASVISAAGGTFTYEGKTYVASGASLGQLYSYLASDDIDLTADQASQAIGMMYENIAAGVEGGYLIQIGGDDVDGEDNDNNTNKKPAPEEEPKNEPKPYEELEIVPQDVTPEAEGILDELFEINRYQTADDEEEDDITEPIPEPQPEKEEKEVPREAPAAVWIALAVGMAVLVLTVIAVTRKPSLKAMTALAAEKQKELGFTDIHCHALYGLDDGAKTLEDSFAMVEMMRQEGVRNVVFTFHIGTNSSGERIRKAENHLKQMEERFPDMKFYLGNEILNGSHMQKALVDSRNLTMAGSDYVLVEFLPGASYEEILQRVRKLVNGGYRPIIAHMERYNCCFNDMECIQELIRMGAYVQINSSSFVGSMVDKRARFVVKLLKNGMVHFIADDCHDQIRRRPRMGSVYMYLLKKKGIEKQTLDRVFRENPEKIIKNQAI